MSDLGSAIPQHIPADLVFDLDMFADARLVDEPHAFIMKLRQEAPPIFFTPRNGGHWMITRASDALEIFRRWKEFSSDPAYNANVQRHPVTIPVSSDPPAQTEYRRILTPFFAPTSVANLEPQIRKLAAQVIDKAIAKGRCEFVMEVSQRFPVGVFLTMAGAPIEDGELLFPFADIYVRSSSREDRNRGLAEMGKYIQGEFAKRRENMGDDVLSYLLRAKFKDRSLTEEELLGIGSLLFLAGLDTVGAALAFTMAFLAQNPDHYRRLVEDRDFIEKSVEELLRAHAGGTPERGASRDFQYKGIQFKKNDRILMPTTWYGYDPNELEEPLRVDFDREISRHMVFGAGPHRCLGSHLARLELRIFLEEWTVRIPAFRLEGQVKSRPGRVWMPDRLDLVWDSRS